MRVSADTAAAHRQALLEHAGRLFRGRGIGAVSVAALSRAAGLTHGAVYSHFPSKEALAAEATATSLEAAAERWRRRAARARAERRDPLAAIVHAYLSPAHRDAPADGCALASLGPEISRAEPPLADALRAGSEALAAVLAEEIATRSPAADARAAALAMLATMAGGIALARTLAADPAASQAALDAAAHLALAAAGEASEGRVLF